MKRGRNDPCSCGSGRKYKKCCGDGPGAPSAPATDVSLLFIEAAQERQLGRLERAEQLYLEVLAADPRHIGALQELGTMAMDAGQLHKAVDLIRRAIAVAPGSFQYHGNLGHALQQLGLFEDAAAAYGEALRLNPESVDVLGNLGGLLLTMGRPEDALPHLRKAVALDPLHPIVLTNLALVLYRLGHSRDAKQFARQAVDVAPECAATVSSSARILIELKRWNEALPFCERWLALEPVNAKAHQALGDCLYQTGRKHEAARHYWKALQLRPDFPEAANNLGLCLAEDSKYEEALVLYHKAVEINPDLALAWTNMGDAMRNLGQVEAALQCHDKALTRMPGNLQVLWNRSLCLLALGRLAEGWEDHEKRCVTAGSRLRPFAHPRWDGSDPAGKTILVWMEQGLGDEVLFASMLPDLIRAGAHCVVECDPRLVTLLRRSFPGIEAVPMTTPAHPRTFEPDISAEIAAGSLPRLFRPSLQSFPQRPGYLIPDPLRAREWEQRLAALGDGLKAGICWRSMINRGNRSRFYSQLPQWGPILTIPGVHFVNLQYGRCDDELRESERLFGARISVWNDMDLTNDQDGLAALISKLDVVVSGVTAVAEMAGALGTRSLVITSEGVDWTCLGQDYNPWHPRSRYFYSKALGPWEPVIERVAAALRSLTGSLTDASL